MQGIRCGPIQHPLPQCPAIPSAVARVARPAADEANERWCMDFISDGLADGRRLRMLTILDTCTRECLAVEVSGSLRGKDVAAVLTRVGVERGLPSVINCDNGSEFTSRALDHWAYENGVKLDIIRPGKPTDNAHIEAFHARLRQECLSQPWFLGLIDARRTIEAWRKDYNNHRPHSALDNQARVQYRLGGRFEPDRRRLQILRIWWVRIGGTRARDFLNLVWARAIGNRGNPGESSHNARTPQPSPMEPNKLALTSVAASA